MFSSVSKPLFIKFSNVTDYRQVVLVSDKIHFFSNILGNIQREDKQTQSALHPVSAWSRGTLVPRNIAGKVYVNTD